jgi:hypothetical protein
MSASPSSSAAASSALPSESTQVSSAPSLSTVPSATLSPSESATAAPTASPTATTSMPSATATPTAAPSVSSAPNVSGAGSLQYSVSVTDNGVDQGHYTYYGKNIGTSSFAMRIDFFDTDGTQSSYIINTQQQKVWVYSDSTWEDLSIAYAAQYATWDQAWQGYVTALGAWNGIGDYSYSANGVTVQIYDISVNPNLPDSLFTPS